MTTFRIYKTVFYAAMVFTVLAAVTALSNEDVVWKKEITKNFKPLSVIFSPDGSKIYCSGNGGYTILDTESGEVLEKITGDYGKILRFSPDGKYIYTEGLYKLDAVSLEPLMHGNYPYGYIGINKNCDVIVGGTSRVNWVPYERLIIINPETMTKYAAINHQGRIYDVEVSPDATYFATSSYDGDFQETKYARLTLWSIENKEKIKILVEGEDIGDISNLRFSPDGTMFAAKVEGKIHIWNTETWEELEGIECITERIVYTFTFSPDSKYLVCGTGDKDLNYPTIIVKIHPCSLIHNYNYPLCTTNSVNVSPDSKYVLSFRNGPPMHLLRAHWQLSSLEDKKMYLPLTPNPTMDKITINLNPNLTYQIRIYDVDSNLLYNNEIINQKTYTYNVEYLATGTYFILLESQNKLETYKFIKE